MLNNQSTFTQVQKFIDAGIARRLDMSIQVELVMSLQRARIEADKSISPPEKAKLIRQLELGVERRVKQFAPSWQYPPLPESPEA